MPQYFKPWKDETSSFFTNEKDIKKAFDSFFEELSNLYASVPEQPSAEPPTFMTGTESSASQLGRSAAYGKGSGYEYDFSLRDLGKKGVALGVKEGIKLLADIPTSLESVAFGLGTAPISKAKGAFGTPSPISLLTELATAFGGSTVAGPVGAIAGSFAGRYAGELLGDVFGTRKEERLRDYIEKELFGTSVPTLRSIAASQRWSGTTPEELEGWFAEAEGRPDFIERSLRDYARETEQFGKFEDIETGIFEDSLFDEDPFDLGDPFDTEGGTEDADFDPGWDEGDIGGNGGSETGQGGLDVGETGGRRGGR